jgi:sulfate transport system substrate-binding protein
LLLELRECKRTQNGEPLPDCGRPGVRLKVRLATIRRQVRGSFRRRPQLNRAITVGLIFFLLVGANGCRRSSITAREASITLYGFSVVKEPLENEIFSAFASEWEKKTGQKIGFQKSFGGSELITNQILSGVEADIAILAIDRNAAKLLQEGATKSDWRSLPHKGIVNRTPMIILVRQGNPKKIRDFADLARPGVKLIHPDPISSGGGQWSLLAIYGSEIIKTERQTGQRDEAKAFDLLRNVWKNVIATPGSAREARTQFERGEGDALVTYELDALQLLDKSDQFKIVAPPCTIFSEHPVVIIDHGMSPTKYALVELFARYLWSEPVQQTWVKYHFRSVTDEKMNEREPRFAAIGMPFTIDAFGGWEHAYPEIVEKVWKRQVQGLK